MIPITANHQFMIPAENFAIQADAQCQLTASVDGTTYSNVGEAFTGVKIISNAPRGLFYKCTVDVKLTY